MVLVSLFAANARTNLDQFSPARKTILAPEMEWLANAVNQGADKMQIGAERVYNEYRLYEDYGMRQRIEDVWGSSPLRLARYAKLFDHFPLDRMWQLTGVNYVLTWRRELFGPSTLVAQFPQVKDATYLHRLPDANPRAWFVEQVQPATDEAALKRLADHTFDLAKTALLSIGGNSATTSVPLGNNTVKLVRPGANQLHVEVDSERGSFLIVSENWMPGWQVRSVECGVQNAECGMSPVSGLQSFTVYRTDLTLIGVPVPAGQTRFDLVYWPDSVRYGLWISGLTAALLIVACLWRAVRLRKR